MENSGKHGMSCSQMCNVGIGQAEHRRGTVGCDITPYRLPGNPNNQKQMDVSTVPTTCYVKDLKQAKLASNHCLWLGWGKPRLWSLPEIPASNDVLTDSASPSSRSQLRDFSRSQLRMQSICCGDSRSPRDYLFGHGLHVSLREDLRTLRHAWSIHP